jgi:glycosyltransferase involved in cell wall biosynthesis
MHHRHLLQEADLVVCAAPRVADDLRAERPDCLHLPNGADSRRFPVASEPVALDPRVSKAITAGHPVAGCYGLGDSLDGDLLMELARRRPEWRFVVITESEAEAAKLKPLAAQPNLMIVSDAPYEALPHYLAQFTVTLLPARVTLAESAPSLLYESLASGKPVVSAPLPECQTLTGAYVAVGVEEFAQALDLARQDADSTAFQSRLRELSRKHSWQARSKMVIDCLKSVRRKARFAHIGLDTWR